jgi:signal transduction histidine kinase
MPGRVMRVAGGRCNWSLRDAGRHECGGETFNEAKRPSKKPYSAGVISREHLSGRVLFAVAAAYAVFAALVSYWFTLATGLSLWTLRPDSSASFGYIFAMNAVLWCSWPLFAPAVFGLARRYCFARNTWQRALLVHLPASLVVTTAHIVFVATGRFALQTLWGVHASWTNNVYDAFFRTLDFELPVYWALVGLQHALDYHRAVRERELTAAQLETRLVAAQLDTLQHQLHPHFLFNTLHAISALVHRDPEKADVMIERLSDLLRLTLDKVGVQEVRLREELEYLQAYLDIEQVHFGERLEIEYEIDPTTYDALVPNLILQPLAENAIRHGLEPQASKGRLTIESARDGDRLTLAVRDTGRGVRAGGAGQAGGGLRGLGLSNTRARLRKLYRDAAALDLSANSGGGTVATVTLPLRTA